MKQSHKTLLLWVLLIMMFLAIWQFLSPDRPAATQVAHVLRRAHAGAIVDLHDAEGTPQAPARLCEALPVMIDGLAAAGYGFGTVGELLAS